MLPAEAIIVMDDSVVLKDLASSLQNIKIGLFGFFNHWVSPKFYSRSWLQNTPAGVLSDVGICWREHLVLSEDGKMHNIPNIESRSFPRVSYQHSEARMSPDFQILRRQSLNWPNPCPLVQAELVNNRAQGLLRLLVSYVHALSLSAHFKQGLSGRFGALVGARTHFQPLQGNEYAGQEVNNYNRPRPFQSRTFISIQFALYLLEICCGLRLCFWGVDRLGYLSLRTALCGFGQIVFGTILFVHGSVSVTQKYLLTSPNSCNTLIRIGRTQMANVLSNEKQVAVIGALGEGSSIRSIERITGIHRDTMARQYGRGS